MVLALSPSCYQHGMATPQSKVEAKHTINFKQHTSVAPHTCSTVVPVPGLSSIYNHLQHVISSARST